MGSGPFEPGTYDDPSCSASSSDTDRTVMGKEYCQGAEHRVCSCFDPFLSAPLEVPLRVPFDAKNNLISVTESTVKSRPMMVSWHSR
jgi:hypothetical protein